MSFYNQKWDKPYLTPSLAVTLLKKTPYHAKLACPFFGPTRNAPTPAMEDGNIVDGLVLGGGTKVVVFNVKTFSTKVMQQMRDNARAAGKIPAKIADMKRHREAAWSIRDSIGGHCPEASHAMAVGDIKQRIFWESNGVACSTEPDVHCEGTVLDLKRTRVPPTVDNWRRHAASMNYHIQAAATLEATGANRFGWVVVEADFPHCVVVHWATDLFLKTGQRDWDYAKSIWANCIESAYFPAYEGGEIDPMPWMLGDDEDIIFTEGEE